MKDKLTTSGRRVASIDANALAHLLWCVLLLFTSSVSAQGLERPNADAGPTLIESQLLLLDLDDISGADQQFTANVYLLFQWHDPRLAGRWPEPTLTPLSDIWHPGLLVANRKFALSGLADTARVDPDGTVHYVQQLWGHFSQKMDLRDFPMDSHELDVVVVSTRAEVGEVEFVGIDDAPSGFSDNLSITGWRVDGVTAEGFEYRPTTNTGPVPAFRLRFTATREVTYYVLKMLLPMILIVAMSWLVFWIEPTEGGTQISVAVTAMLTLIAYQFLVSGLLPPVSYLTRLDGFILVATVMVFATLLEVIITSRLAAADRVGLARRIDVVCRIGFPAAFLVLLVIAFVL